jgi:hypothetical protein
MQFNKNRQMRKRSSSETFFSSSILYILGVIVCVMVHVLAQKCRIAWSRSHMFRLIPNHSVYKGALYTVRLLGNDCRCMSSSWTSERILTILTFLSVALTLCMRHYCSPHLKSWIVNISRPVQVS